MKVKSEEMINFKIVLRILVVNEEILIKKILLVKWKVLYVLNLFGFIK